ncbi:MAG TPA: hypothetical protein VK742_05980 [Candidatus Sulfotelmatobacter sp.]|nr:hypothetical protein [Candidatus Sulfotelmatobacter sp.]
MKPDLDKPPVSKATVAFGCSLALCCVLNALLVMVKEKSPALQAAMKKLTGHHWVTHASVILVLFVFFGWLFARIQTSPASGTSVNKLIKMIIAGVLAAGLMITGFYLLDLG